MFNKDIKCKNFLLLSDISECLTFPCGPTYKSINVPGYYQSVCLTGYRRNGSDCLGK